MTADIGLWQAPPEDPVLEPCTLALWRFTISSSGPDPEPLPCPLERSRAARLIDSGKRRQFSVARATLRRVLGAYLNLSPAALVFDYGSQGKPSLITGGAASLHFNLSHARDWGVIAVLQGASVGVDLEWIAPARNLQTLADHAFDADEKRMFSACSPARRQRGFYRIWTRKEARLKYLGIGLGGEMSAPAPGYQRWFALTKGYLAAVATDSRVKRVLRYHIDP